MKIKIHVVNGIRSHGIQNIDRLKEPLEKLGYEVYDPQLPKRGFTARFKKSAVTDAKIIANNAHDGDVVIGHSYGGERIAEASLLINFSLIILFRAAIEVDREFGGDCPIVCVHSATDMALRAGRLMIKHPFGEAGLHGMADPRVVNVQSYGDHNEDFESRLDLSVALCDEWIKSVS